MRIADHPIDDQFLTRHSPRAFSAQQMSEKQVMQLLEAARWAPSASNNQPWRAAWGLRGDAGFDKIAASLKDFNAAWAPKASALIAWAARSTVARDGAENPNPWAAFDAGTAWGFMALQAQKMGLITHAMGGFDAGALAQSLEMPAEYHLHAVIAVGYLGDANDLPESYRAREVPSARNSVDTWAKQGGFV